VQLPSRQRLGQQRIRKERIGHPPATAADARYEPVEAQLTERSADVAGCSRRDPVRRMAARESEHQFGAVARHDARHLEDQGNALECVVYVLVQGRADPQSPGRRGVRPALARPAPTFSPRRSALARRFALRSCLDRLWLRRRHPLPPRRSDLLRRRQLPRGRPRPDRPPRPPRQHPYHHHHHHPDHDTTATSSTTPRAVAQHRRTNPPVATEQSIRRRSGAHRPDPRPVPFTEGLIREEKNQGVTTDERPACSSAG